MTRNRHKQTAPHTVLAVFAIGIMALALAIGLEFLQLMKRINAVIMEIFSSQGMGGAVVPLDPITLWCGTAVLAFALPAVILHIPDTWRRLVIWIGTLVLTISWAPVLVLAAREPQIGVAIVAVVWAGFGAIFYAANHILPVDEIAVKPIERS